MKNDVKIITKPEKLAQIIYEAVIRYTKAKKPQIGEKIVDLGLDIPCVWRGNKKHKIDVLENNYDFRKRK